MEMDGSFVKFNELLPELRRQIWDWAIRPECQSVTSRPNSRTSWNEREAVRRFRSEYPTGAEPISLRVRIWEKESEDLVGYAEDQFEGLVHSFALAAVCKESLRCVAEACRGFAEHITFEYSYRGERSMTQSSKDNRTIRRGKFYPPGVEARPHFDGRPTKIYLPGAANLPHFDSRPRHVSTHKNWFDDCTHMVDKIADFLGSNIVHLDFDIRNGNTSDLAHIPWASSRRRPICLRPDIGLRIEGRVPVLRMNESGDYELSEDYEEVARCIPGTGKKSHNSDYQGEITVVNDTELYIPDGFSQPVGLSGLDRLRYIVQAFDIFDAASSLLPRLKQIDIYDERHYWYYYGLHGEDMDCDLSGTTRRYQTSWRREWRS